VVAATAARDALIAEYQSLLKALDELRAAHATLTAREAAQVDLLRDRDVELARRVLEHERLKEELARHESMLARRQAAVEDQQATLARQQATIEHQQAILQQQQATLATIYGSLAWSVTNELRAVKDRSLGAPGSWQRRLYDRVAAAVRRRTGRRAGS
jgi:uncharacterized protein YdaU (DUF1376 family)